MNIILQTHLKCAPFQIWMDHKKDLHSSWNQTHIWSPRSCQAKLLKFVWIVKYAPLLQLPETYTQVLESDKHPICKWKIILTFRFDFSNVLRVAWVSQWIESHDGEWVSGSHFQILNLKISWTIRDHVHVPKVGKNVALQLK